MGRRRVGKGGFIHDLHNLVWRICDEKKITLQELEEAVGASPKAFSQIKQSTELNWRMFKKLVLEVYPMALFDDVGTVEAFYKRIQAMHEGLAPEKRNATWEEVRGYLQKVIEKRDKLQTERTRTIKTANSGGVRGSKKGD